MELPYTTYWYKQDHENIIREYEHDVDIYGTDQDTISSIYTAKDAALLYEESLNCQEEKEQ